MIHVLGMAPYTDVVPRSTFGKRWEDIYSDPAFVEAKRAKVAALGHYPRSVATRAKLSAARAAMARPFAEHLASPDTAARFWAKVDRHGPLPEARPELGPCWLWTASTKGRGYGGFGVGPRVLRAHQFAYLTVVGPLPPGTELDHLCRRPACVNPAHLEAVAHRVNVQRGRAGEANRLRTECIRGHPFYVRPNGRRACRECARDAQRRYRASV